MASDLISNSEAWFKLTPAQRKAVTKIDFEERYKSGNNTLYNKANAATRARIEQAHTQVIEEGAYNSEFNPSVQAAKANQEDADNSGTIFNWGRQIVDSHKDLAGRLDFFKQAVAEDSDAASVGEKYFSKKREQVQTEDTKQLASDLKVGFDTWKQEGFINKLKGLGEIVGAAASNPVGVMDVAAQSMSSMTSMGLGALGGAKTGGAVGSIFGPQGAIAGALWGGRAGAVGAETVDATSAKFAELLKAKLDENELVPTESNIAGILADKEWFTAAKSKALTYGSSLSLADQALAGMATKFAELPMKAAKTAARAGLTEAQHASIATLAQTTGKTVEAATDTIVDGMAAATLKAASFKKKLGIGATHYVGEVASEPISEAIGTASAGDENTIENLTMETLGGIGTGPFGVAINKATWGTKLATDKAVQVGKDIITSTPESRAAVADIKTEITKANALNKAEIAPNYDEEIAKADPEDTAHANLSNPNHDDYNPVKAIDIVAKTNDPSAHTQAVKIAMDYFKQVTETKTKLDTLAETGVDTPAYRKLAELYDDQYKVAKRLFDRVDVIKTKVTDRVNPNPVPIDPVKDTAEEVVKKFGSHGTFKNTLPEPVVDELLARTDLDVGFKKELTAHKDATAARKSIEEHLANKGMAEVSTDIYHGARGSFFKGIDDYQQGIKYFLNPKSDTDSTPRNPEKAKAELDGLKKFSAVMQEKAAVAKAVFNAMVADKTYKPTPAQQVVLVQHGLEIHPVKSKNLVPAIIQEADALQKEVKLAQMTYKRLSGQTNTTTSTPVQKPVTEHIQKPKTAPVTSTPVVISVPTTPIAKPITEAIVSNKPSNKIGFTLTTKTPFTAKDQKKADIANAFIGFGVQRAKGISSTGQYANDATAQGIPVNEAIKPNATTVAFVSVSGEGTHVAKTIEHARKVLDAGGTVVMDAAGNKPGQAGSTHNINGEGAVQKGIMKLLAGQTDTYIRSTINGITTFKQSAAQRVTNTTTPQTETVKPDPVTAPQTNDNKKDIVAPAPEEIVASTTSPKIIRHKDNDGFDFRGAVAIVKDGVAHINRSKIKSIFNNRKSKAEVEDLNTSKPWIQIKFKELGVTPEQFFSLFKTEQELEQYYINHELAHIENDDPNNQAYNDLWKSLADDPNRFATFKTNPLVIAMEVRATLSGLTGKQKEVLESLKVTPETVTAESEDANNIVDSMAEYDIDYSTLEITYTNTKGETVTESYEDAMNKHNQQVAEAKAVLECTNSKS